ncbi:MAG: hypothetical protein WBO17_02605 [Sphingorhabdus sp.]
MDEMSNAVAVAHMLLGERQARAAFLATLHEAAEPCWLILLQIYVAKDKDGSALDDIARVLDMRPSAVERLAEFMDSKGYILRSVRSGRTIVRLEPATRHAFELLLDQISYDFRPASG